MANENITISQNGLNLIKDQEGCVLTIYRDNAPAKNLTVGIGHMLTQSEIASGIYNNGITLEQAFEILRQDVKHTEDQMRKYITIQLNQNQWDAVVSLCFNTGIAPVATGTFGKELNAGNFTAAANEMLKWCHAGGQVLPVLQRRRQIEAALFSKPVDLNSPASIQDPGSGASDPSAQINPIFVPPTLSPVDIDQPESPKLTLNFFQQIFSFISSFLKK